MITAVLSRQYGIPSVNLELFNIDANVISLIPQEVAQKPKEEAPKGPVAYKISYPVGLDPESAHIPADNPLTEEKIKLGKKLYFEKGMP